MEFDIYAKSHQFIKTRPPVLANCLEVMFRSDPWCKACFRNIPHPGKQMHTDQNPSLTK